MHKNRRFFGLILVLIFAGCFGSLAQQDAAKQRNDFAQPIPDQLKIPDAPKTARQVDCFQSFTERSTVIDVVRKCGVPDEHQGSGIYIFIYRLDDGSAVLVGTTDLKRLLYVTHRHEGKADSLLLKLQQK